MSCEALHAAREIFGELVERPAEERAALLEAACGDDPRLKTRVEQLLAADEHAASFLKTPIGPIRALEKRAAAHPVLIGRYSIQRIMASGGMGTVYEAVQQQPRRTVAVKVMRAGLTSESALRRFEYESQLLARLRHPGIAQVYESGTHDEPSGPVPYFAMEYIPGAKPITAYARRKKLDIRARVELFAQVCDAVDHGHQKGIIHRDLKPSNVLVDGEGRPKIIDFGVARSADSETLATALQTQAGQLIGTLQYMSPEQCAADPHDLDTRSDVYALGMILYELLSGRRPYDVTRLTLPEATRVIREDAPSRLRTVDARLGGDLDTIVQKALEKDRDRRYRSAAELADDLRRYLAGEAILARPPSIAYQVRVFARRHKTLVGSVAAVLVALTLGVIGTSRGMIQARRQRNEAEDARAEAVEVTRFLTGTLSAANTYAGRGPDVTLREVLDEAAEQLDRDETLADRPRVKATLHATIGKTYTQFGTYLPEAEKHLRAALAIRRRILGPEHPEVAECLHDLAIALRWKDEAAEHERLLREALAMRRKLLGEEHPDTLETINALATWYRDLGRDDAEPLYREALRGRRKALGDEHVAVAESLLGLGTYLHWCERYNEAEPLLQEALAIFQKRMGPQHPFVAETLTVRAMVAWDQGDLDLAETRLRRALEIGRKMYGDESVDLPHNLTALGRLLYTKGELQEAEKLLREAVQKYALARGDRTAVHPRVLLGRCLTQMGRYSEAEAELLGIYQAPARPERADARLRPCIKALIALYEAWGKPEKAAEYRTRLAEVNGR